jgi:hypothetical protein
MLVHLPVAYLHLKKIEELSSAIKLNISQIPMGFINMFFHWLQSHEAHLQKLKSIISLTGAQTYSSLFQKKGNTNFIVSIRLIQIS